MTTETSQTVSTLQDVEPLESIAHRLSEGFGPRVQESLVTSMSSFFEETTTVLGDKLTRLPDPKRHRMMTISRLTLAGLNSSRKAQDLYRSVLEEYSSQVSQLAGNLDNLSDPFIDSLTLSLKAVNHRPNAVADFLRRYIAPANEERDGWSWQFREGMGNAQYNRRVDVAHHGAHMFALFFDLKKECDNHDFVMIDCVSGDAHATWQFLKEHVSELYISIAKVDLAYDVKCPGGYETLNSITQSHRISWSKSVIPAYGSYNADNPTQGRTSYFGKLPGTGGRSGTFTVRIYDKGKERLRKDPKSVSDLTPDEIENWARIECSSSPGTPGEKHFMAQEMAKDIRAAWGLKAFTSELMMKIEGRAAARIPKSEKVVKSPYEKKVWLLETYGRMLREFYDGRSVLNLITDLRDIADVHLDTFGLLENISKPAPDENFHRLADYAALHDYLDDDGAFSKLASESKTRRENEKSDANCLLASGYMPSMCSTPMTAPPTSEEIDSDQKIYMDNAIMRFHDFSLGEFVSYCSNTKRYNPTFSVDDVLYRIIDDISSDEDYDNFVSRLSKFARLMPVEEDHFRLFAFLSLCGYQNLGSSVLDRETGADEIVLDYFIDDLYQDLSKKNNTEAA